MTKYYAQTDIVYRGGEKIFSIPFSYIKKEHLKVYIDTLETTDYVFNNASQIQINANIENGQTVSIKRTTPVDKRFIRFTNQSILDKDVQNLNTDQLFYAFQELADRCGVSIDEFIEVVNNAYQKVEEATDRTENMAEFIQDFKEQLEQTSYNFDEVNEIAQKALEDIKKSSELALSSHFMGEFVKSSLPFVDEHLTEADGKNLDNTNEFFASFYTYLKALKEASDKSIYYHRIFGKGSHLKFWTKTAPLVNGDEVLIRLDKDKTYMKPIDKIGDEETRLTLVKTFNLFSYRRYKLLSSSGNIPEYITPILTGEDDGSALWNPLGYNSNPIDADKFYATDFNNVTLTPTELVVVNSMISDVDGVEQYKVELADGAVGYYELTPCEPLQVITDIELPYYYHADCKAGYEYEGADVFIHNDNYLTDWEYYNAITNDTDYRKYYLPDKSSADFYNGYEPKYTHTDTVTTYQQAIDVPVETMDKEKVYITTKYGYPIITDTLGVGIDGNIGKIATSKEVRFALDNIANTPNNAVYREHPVIENNIASGFSTTAYMVAPDKNINKGEYVIKIHTPTAYNARQGVVCHSDNFIHVEVYWNVIRYYTWGTGGIYNLTTVDPDTDYWVKVAVDYENKIKTYSYSLDGENWSDPIETTDTAMNIETSKIVAFGNTSNAWYTASYYFDGGKIYLDDTYIKEGDEVIWRGTDYDNNESISLGDVYFEFITPDTFINSTEILHLNRAVGFFIQNKNVTNPNGTISIVPELWIKGGRHGSGWIMYQSTNIPLETNTRYALTFNTIPDTVNKRPLRWEVELVNLIDGTIHTFAQDTIYYPYNLANGWGFTGIYSQWDYLTPSDCIIDLDSIVIKGQHYTINGLKQYKDRLSISMNKDTIYLPKISDKEGEKTYIVLNGVQAVNTAYAIDLSPYALKEETYSKEDIDGMEFVKEEDLPVLDDFVDKETFNEFSSNVVNNFAIKQEIPQKLGDLQNDLNFTTMDAVESRFVELYEQAQIGNLDN